jgi:hypothetical protein
MTESNKITSEQLLEKHYFHEADRMNQRTDWFLIFHAILMEAFFSIKKSDPASILVVGSVGLLLSCLWLLSGLRSARMAWHMGLLIREEMNPQAAKMHAKLFATRAEVVNRNFWYGWTKFLPLFGVVISAIFVIAWLALILIRYPGSALCILYYILGAVILVLCLIATLITKVIEPFTNRPPVPLPDSGIPQSSDATQE